MKNNMLNPVVIESEVKRMEKKFPIKNDLLIIIETKAAILQAVRDLNEDGVISREHIANNLYEQLDDLNVLEQMAHQHLQD